VYVALRVPVVFVGYINKSQGSWIMSHLNFYEERGVQYIPHTSRQLFFYVNTTVRKFLMGFTSKGGGGGLGPNNLVELRQLSGDCQCMSASPANRRRLRQQSLAHALPCLLVIAELASPRWHDA
jgi:hypothetical protein